MIPLRWTGRLTPAMRLLVDANSALAWATGAARDVDAMRRHVKSGYEGEMSDDVNRYDELCLAPYARIAGALLDGVDVPGREVLDIGCGTGALAFESLARGATSVMCADVSELMLERCERNARDRSVGDRVSYHLIGGTSGPLEPGRFDVALSSMVLGFVPAPESFMNDAARVVRPGGVVGLAAQGPEFDWEGIDAAFRAMPKRFVLGYRVEFWPRSEAIVRGLFDRARLTDVRIAHRAWTVDFDDPSDAFDFFCASSSAFWLAKVPPSARQRVASEVRDGFRRRAVHRLTHDVVFAYGRAPAS